MASQSNMNPATGPTWFLQVRVAQLSITISVKTIDPSSSLVWEMTPVYRASGPATAVAPLQLTWTVPVVPEVADEGALSTFKLPPGVAETLQVSKSYPVLDPM